MSDHVDRVTLLAYIDGDASTDRGPVDAHLAGCVDCREALEELQQVMFLLRDSDMLHHPTDADALRRRSDIRTELLVEEERLVREVSVAEESFDALMRQPMEAWEGVLDRCPDQRTGSLVRRLVAEVEVELNRRPQQALALLAIAEGIARSLGDSETRLALGDVWKHRSNALRHLGRFQEAVDAALVAESFYASLLTGDFDVAQARYTRAGALFKMTRLGEARGVLTQAASALRDYGPTVPLAKTIMLEAAICYEEGDIEAAQVRWREVVPILEHFEDRVELARVRANLAECNLRLGASSDAMADATAAINAYRSLGMDAEAVRTQWTVGMILLARGEDGLGHLRDAATAFAAIGMVGDAGFVQLDIAEELLKRGEWIEAENIARELAGLFTSAGVTMASVTALDYLRQAVSRRDATPDVVRYVRNYVAQDDPAAPFAPPRRSDP